MKDIRKKALFIIDNVLYKGAFLNEELLILSKSKIDKRDYNLIVNITTGVVQNKLLLEHIVSKYSKIKIKKIHRTILTILQMGIYQIFFTSRIPDYSIINESVNLAKIFGNQGSAGFVNGLLRNILRDKENIEKSEFWLNDVKETDYAEYLSIYYSHPKFYVDLILEEKGKDFTKELLKCNNVQAPFTIRVNTLKCSVEDLAGKLKKRGFDTEKTKYSKNALIVKNPESILDSFLFKEGYFYIQDEASMLVSEFTKFNEKAKVLDLCSAPGGKSFNIAMLNRDASIILCDISNKKISLIRENMERLGIKNIKILKNDATIYNKTFYNLFDNVIVDAPCSGLGLYRRKPEIKWNRKPEDIEKLTKIQMNIINNASKYVKIGGIITYSTCTITREENEDIINKFLDENKNFEIEKIENSDILKIYTNTHNMDGFSIAKIKRIN
ncbi:16S rRNA (cytosine(967)-C(5))-methyltransferase RsmB [Peptoniphilus mikwangii]|uniref:16S rRNA (cytosine(967)-C(5))-methyltransferase RsmB n=1 Tax=Peptoniphilus mikwangii TaxID=1354300 RepID=UPI0003FF3EB9|nr:16S rRNA (cytosine(967)-C(5))-methyltransferase RsmB [Peptoniphilus mikwangii]